MRKVRLFLVAVVCVLFGIYRVNALELTVDQVLDEVERGEMFQLLKETSTLDISRNDKYFGINLNSEGKTYTSLFTHEGGIIEYRLDMTLDDQGLIEQGFVDALWIGEIASATAKLNGYNVDDLLSLDETLLTFEDNGIEVKTFKREYDEEGSHVSLNGISYMKLDINNLRFEGADNPSKPSDTQVPSLDLSASDGKVNLVIGDYSSGASCKIYRSKDEEALSLIAVVPCKDGYVDASVLADTTYTYRIGTVDNFMSGPVSIRTSKTSNSESGTVQNPNTGIVSYVFVLTILALASIGGFSVLNKNSAFKRL